MTWASGATVVVELTPAGRGAVAVVLVSGPLALGVLRECFTPATCWSEDDPRIGRIAYGRWGGIDGEELIVCRRGDSEFEIHCHGGVAAAPAIVRELSRRGCQLISWQEWLRGSSQDAIRTAAQIKLADASTSRTAAILLDQYHGALSSAVDAAIAVLDSGNRSQAVSTISEILAFRDVGLRLTTPWRIVLVGAPNVGKSSLINAMAGFQRSIISPLPGTTRDVVTTRTAIDGWPVQLADTAGLRETGDEVESAGVALAGAALAEAELAIVVSDASTGLTEAKRIMGQLRPGGRAIHVLNKVDLLNDVERAQSTRSVAELAGGSAAVQRVSALTGFGLADLLTCIGQTLVPHAPPAGAAVPFTAGQVERLEAAEATIIHGSIASAAAMLRSLLIEHETTSE